MSAYSDSGSDDPGAPVITIRKPFSLDALMSELALALAG